MSGKTVTITGGSGFVGQLLARGLRERGYRVRIFDKYQGALINLLRRRYLGNADHPRQVTRMAARINRWLHGAECTLARCHFIRPTNDDILDERERIAGRFRGSEAVIHLAAIPHPHVRGMTAADFQRINYEGAVRIADAAQAAGVPRFVFSSSAQVYCINKPVRIDRFPIAESNYCPTLEEGQTLYGHLKRKFEDHLAATCRASGKLQSVSLRLEFPGVRSKSGNNLYVSTSLENTVAGFARAIEADLGSPSEVVNLADAHVDERVVDVQKFLKTKWAEVPNDTTGNACLLDVQRARTLLGYDPIRGGTYLSSAVAWR